MKNKNLATNTYDRLIEEGRKIGKTVGRLEATIRMILVAFVELPDFSNKNIAKLIITEEVFVQEIRTILEEKKLKNLNQFILKEFQKIGITDKEITASIRALAKKYYLLFYENKNDK